MERQKNGDQRACPTAPRRAADRVAASATAGFTLIELMVVAVVLAVLAAAIVPAVIGRIGPAKRTGMVLRP